MRLPSSLATCINRAHSSSAWESPEARAPPSSLVTRVLPRVRRTCIMCPKFKFRLSSVPMNHQRISNQCTSKPDSMPPPRHFHATSTHPSSQLHTLSTPSPHPLYDPSTPSPRPSGGRAHGRHAACACLLYCKSSLLHARESRHGPRLYRDWPSHRLDASPCISVSAFEMTLVCVSSPCLVAMSRRHESLRVVSSSSPRRLLVVSSSSPRFISSSSPCQLSRHLLVISLVISSSFGDTCYVHSSILGT